MTNLFKYITAWKLYKEKTKTNFNKKVWEARKPLIEIQNQIKQEQKELNDKNKELKSVSCSKLFLAFLFLNFTILEVFIGWVTIQSFSLALNIGMMPDFTPLVTLIGAVIGQTLSYGIYSSKAKAENTDGGITYEMAKWQMEQELYGNNTYGGGCG